MKFCVKLSFTRLKAHFCMTSVEPKSRPFWKKEPKNLRNCGWDKQTLLQNQPTIPEIQPPLSLPSSKLVLRKRPKTLQKCKLKSVKWRELLPKKKQDLHYSATKQLNLTRLVSLCATMMTLWPKLVSFCEKEKSTRRSRTR